MSQLKITRPHFPAGYVDRPTDLLPWSHVEHRLTEARNFWLCTLRPDGRPHAVPLWCVWVEGKIYFDGSPETRHARNIGKNPSVTVHLESGEDVVILEGTCKLSPKPVPELSRQLAEAYAAKYALSGYTPSADQWDSGGLYEVTPQTVLAWTKFTDDPTKFVFGTP